ncbi:hypothetical protein B0J14DRAFT_191494 [Halenospora varia]|nr:hypothetical protein B0J14DRAFT_191494 [Halenospora varia]
MRSMQRCTRATVFYFAVVCVLTAAHGFNTLAAPTVSVYIFTMWLSSIYPFLQPRFFTGRQQARTQARTPAPQEIGRSVPELSAHMPSTVSTSPTYRRQVCLNSCHLSCCLSVAQDGLLTPCSSCSQRFMGLYKT